MRRTAPGGAGRGRLGSEFLAMGVGEAEEAVAAAEAELDAHALPVGVHRVHAAIECLGDLLAGMVQGDQA